MAPTVVRTSLSVCALYLRVLSLNLSLCISFVRLLLSVRYLFVFYLFFISLCVSIVFLSVRFLWLIKAFHIVLLRELCRLASFQMGDLGFEPVLVHVQLYNYNHKASSSILETNLQSAEPTMGESLANLKFACLNQVNFRRDFSLNYICDFLQFMLPPPLHPPSICNFKQPGK